MGVGLGKEANRCVVQQAEAREQDHSHREHLSLSLCLSLSLFLSLSHNLVMDVPVSCSRSGRMRGTRNGKNTVVTLTSYLSCVSDWRTSDVGACKSH